MAHYEIKFSALFRKQLKAAKKRGKVLTKLQKIIDLLADDTMLPAKYRDHALEGRWVNHRECHIEPDWLLIYYKQEDVLVLTLVATGSHSDLF
ncbi:type II toxin-antitoxin system YafQ family toxin [Collinsella sp. zg1085]|uniref:type II toxin-antitoxin system YafQ family toxin n=1 Tax=Collinsella sp. zg1085 TaxID=2844380 RepID=UPI001C0E453C|nr:type II toxin-antitoxin system YafQ family toxin [Collinsella sp. zg1085]QWT17697.1 type II toxin-antitoxin system YafQ family toxin [Collinsella sp. zg1085]